MQDVRWKLDEAEKQLSEDAATIDEIESQHADDVGKLAVELAEALKQRGQDTKRLAQCSEMELLTATDIEDLNHRLTSAQQKAEEAERQHVRDVAKIAELEKKADGALKKADAALERLEQVEKESRASVLNAENEVMSVMALHAQDTARLSEVSVHAMAMEQAAAEAIQRASTAEKELVAITRMAEAMELETPVSPVSPPAANDCIGADEEANFLLLLEGPNHGSSAVKGDDTTAEEPSKADELTARDRAEAEFALSPKARALSAAEMKLRLSYMDALYDAI